jgi:hypothetical protein
MAERAYADHCAKNGKPQSHQLAKVRFFFPLSLAFFFFDFEFDKSIC